MSEGRVCLEMSLEQERESHEGHTESLQHRPGVLCPPVPARAARRETHTRAGGDGTEEATDGTEAWPCEAKFEHKSFAQLCTG